MAQRMIVWNILTIEASEKYVVAVSIYVSDSTPGMDEHMKYTHTHTHIHTPTYIHTHTYRDLDHQECKQSTQRHTAESGEKGAQRRGNANNTRSTTREREAHNASEGDSNRQVPVSMSNNTCALDDAPPALRAADAPPTLCWSSSRHLRPSAGARASGPKRSPSSVRSRANAFSRSRCSARASRRSLRRSRAR
jgi:hypothetical protein